MPPSEAIPDSMLLDAAYLPPAPGLEPAVVFFGAIELSPGAWRRAEEALAVPELARRLTVGVGDPANPRFTQTRALPIQDAVPYLMSLAKVPVRPSVKAWVIAAHVAQRIHEGQMLPRGNDKTDATLKTVAAGMPPSSYSVLVELLPKEEDPLGPLAQGADEIGYRVMTGPEAMDGFLDIARHALALGPTARTTRPRRGASKTLAGLRMRLKAPRGAADPWLLHVSPSDAEVTREAFDKALRDATAVFRPLERVDPTTPDEPLEISGDEAGALIMASDDLRGSGATLELPESLLTGLGNQVTARLRFGRNANAEDDRARRSTPRFRLDDLVTYDLQVALGGAEVSAEELRQLARTAPTLVRLGEEWVAMTDTTRDQLEKLARAVEARDLHMANATALAATLAGTAQLPGGIAAKVERVDDVALSRAVEYLRNPTAVSRQEVPYTPGFEGELRNYQQAGLSWLAGMADLPLGAVLADDMGLGKTVQIIALLTHLREQARTERAAEVTASAGADAPAEHALDPAVTAGNGGGAPDAPMDAGPPARALVVCPTSLIGNWERELARFAPDLTVLVHHGPARASRASQVAAADVVVTSYGLVARDRAMLGDLYWGSLIFDEAQSVKNPDTEQARAVRTLRGRFRVALTGTPMENRLLELWAILDLVNPTLLGTAGAFSRKFATPIERGGDDKAANTLRAITRPFLLRRVKHDPEIVPDLPEKQEHNVVCTLTPEQAALYQATTEQALAEVRRRDGISRRGAVLSLLTRLKQICNHPAQALGEDDPIAGRSGKLERLEAMLEEVVAEGDRALVFTQYAQMGNLLAKYLPDMLGCDVLYLHGGVQRAVREQLVARFQAESENPMVFVLSLKAGGLGLNLMNAAHVFHYDRWWNPAVEDQATDRTHRIGQTRNVQVHKLVCAGTLEERISQIIDEKRALAGRIIEVSGTGEGWITELGDSELEELVALTQSSMQLAPTGGEA